MIVEFCKWGNSLAERIPKASADSIKVNKGNSRDQSRERSIGVALHSQARRSVVQACSRGGCGVGCGARKREVPVLSTLVAIGDRLSSYRSAEISKEIGPHDGMFVPGGEAHYLAVGRSAIKAIAKVMVATDKTEFGKILDLPCGGGRVTRHLVKFFPDSQIFISELDRRNESFTADTFGAKPIVKSPDFRDRPTQTFDLIFVGSLVTHLDEGQFRTALRWFIDALAPDGVLVMTTSGRRADHCERNINRYIEPGLWESVSEGLHTRGFGYVETERNSAGSYGFTLAAPSWVARLVEMDPSVRLATVQECAWDNHQDVFGIQKRPIA